MSFKIIRAETRLANMVAWFAGVANRQLTDFIVGSKLRTKFETVAVEMEAQDYQFYQAVKKAIPTSIYYAFGFNLRGAVRASGMVTFTAPGAAASDIQIPAGTKVATAATASSPAKIYETTALAVLATGQTTVAVLVQCTAAGGTGNTAADTITVLQTAISGISSVSNLVAFANGADQETEAARAARFTEFVTTLSRGTAAALIYAAKTAALTDSSGVITEQVVAACVTGPPETGSAGVCNVYIYNGSDGASTDLVTRAQAIIDGYTDADGTAIPGYKAAGVIATVAAATLNEVDVTCNVLAGSGVTDEAVASVIATYLQSLDIGQGAIYHEIVERIMAIAGVTDVAFTTPTANVAGEAGHKIVPGTITVTINA